MKAVETGMLLDKIEKLTEAHNLSMDLLKICPGSDGLAPVSHSDVSPCSYCSVRVLMASHQYHIAISLHVHIALVLNM